VNVATGMKDVRRAGRRPVGAVAAMAVAVAGLALGPQAHATDGPTRSETSAGTEEIVRYDFAEQSGDVLHDVSGHERHADVVGGAQWLDGALVLDGVDDYVDLPDDLLAGVTDVTIEADVRIDQAQSGAYFLYVLGNSTAGVGDGYLFTTGNAYRTSLATGNWTTEQTVSQGRDLPRDRWVHLAYVLQGTSATLYLDGVCVATGTVTTTPGQIGGGSTTANALGRSAYAADSLFAGRYRQFAVHGRALSAAEVLDASGNTAALADVGLLEDVLKAPPVVDQAARDVLFPVLPGTDLRALTPVFGTASGATAAPASGTVRDLSVPAEVLVTAGDETATWTMRAVAMGSPALPGLYADPNVVVYGDTYYVYATSDGYPGWGGRDFYVWSSTDLVTWQRSQDPILTLDGDAGTVPWATGNAWAPTIIEKDGRFYFYFSGHHPQLDRKAMGVAVADHPAGPFVAEPEPLIRNTEDVTSGQAIDPAAFRDPATGTFYLFWGNGSPVYAELSEDMRSVVPGTIRRMSGLTDYREATFVHHRDGLYHLTYSIDDTGSPDYRVGYATATSVHGPWTYRGVVLEKDASLGILGTGHNSILNVPETDDWYIVYHRFAVPGGDGQHRETAIDRVTFDPGTGLMNPVTPTLEGVAAQSVVDPQPLAVVLDGAPVVGGVITATVADPWTATQYSWTLDGAVVAGVTGDSYALTEQDEGATLTVRVSAAKPLWTPASAEASTAPVRPADPGPDPLAPATPGGDGEVDADTGTGPGATDPADQPTALGATGPAGLLAAVLLAAALLALGVAARTHRGRAGRALRPGGVTPDLDHRRARRPTGQTGG
jgi:hypothetical protein